MSQELIQELQAILLEDFNEDLSFDEAQSVGEAFLDYGEWLKKG